MGTPASDISETKLGRSSRGVQSADSRPAALRTARNERRTYPHLRVLCLLGRRTLGHGRATCLLLACGAGSDGRGEDGARQRGVAAARTRPSRSRRVRRSPCERSQPPGRTLPRIVQIGTSTRKGTRRSFLTASEKPLCRKHLRDPPLRAEPPPTRRALRQGPGQRPGPKRTRRTSVDACQSALDGVLHDSQVPDRARYAPSSACRVTSHLVRTA